MSYKFIFGDEEVEKFMEMTGVRNSHRALEYQTCSDLGFRAASELLAHKGVKLEEIGATSFEINMDDILPIFEDDAVFEDGLITDPNQLYEKE